ENTSRRTIPEKNDRTAFPTGFNSSPRVPPSTGASELRPDPKRMTIVYKKDAYPNPTSKLPYP
ncbi:MAG: hypothetical protein ACLT1W_12275, partial [Alistipes onderdonkii]